MKSLLFSCILLCVSVYAKDIPDPSKTAQMARYIINNVDWIAISTISTLPSVNSFPFVNLKSVSDGPLGKGTGVPYLLMTNLDLTGRDVLQDNRTTIMASLAEISYCNSVNYDPQDPRCGRLIISGELSKLDETTDEYKMAKNDLFIRHPIMEEWMKVHNFYIAKINIKNILILDNFGGAKTVTVDDYYNANDYSSIKSTKQAEADIVVVQMAVARNYRFKQ
ncbi:PREDICTED: protein CREG1-like [Nicrophorus vespilloides]|uniref:Protein CREG1-like n=1 Tax=Nicrophorus vespilloides TaxID=110193 RepID=A0ABM1MDC8_NICVS|nr:PREDICTED: protein CREG1-like [Nicrophorus vespilloides]XP_017772579.1 PREDICTED: protein CREG1-like [Nicrophorus vespilloides]